METIRAEDFVESCRQSEDAETQARGRNVEIMMRQVSSQVEIVMDGGPDKAMAFVEANGDNVQYVSYSITNDRQTTIHAGDHEDMHNKLKFWNLPVPENFTENHSDVLEAACQFSLLNGDDNKGLMEGFHEMLIIERKGIDSKVAYVHREVPAAQKLDNLSQQLLGTSLFSIYKSGDHEPMARTLKRLADRCLLFRAATEIEDQTTKSLVEVKISRFEVEIDSAEDAAVAVDQLEAETVIERLTAQSSQS